MPGRVLSRKSIGVGEQINASAPLAITALKHNAQSAREASFIESLRNETKAQQKLGQSQDYKEGVAAFLEKRPPTFRACEDSFRAQRTSPRQGLRGDRTHDHLAYVGIGQTGSPRHPDRRSPLPPGRAGNPADSSTRRSLARTDPPRHRLHPPVPQHHPTDRHPSDPHHRWQWPAR